MKKHTDIVLVRHGESLANLNPSLGLEPEYHYTGGREADAAVPLTQFGYEQAIATGKHIRDWIEEEGLEGKKITILHSPYLRAVQTVEGIARGLGRMGDAVETVTDSRIREQEFGILTNIKSAEHAKAHVEVVRAYEKLDAQRAKDKNTALPEGGEGRAQVMERVEAFLTEHAELFNDPSRLVLVVSHGLTSRILQMRLRMQDQEREEPDASDREWLRTSANLNNCEARAIRSDGEEQLVNEGYQRPSLMHTKTEPYGEQRQAERC